MINLLDILRKDTFKWTFNRPYYAFTTYMHLADFYQIKMDPSGPTWREPKYDAHGQPYITMGITVEGPRRGCKALKWQCRLLNPDQALLDAIMHYFRINQPVSVEMRPDSTPQNGDPQFPITLWTVGRLILLSNDGQDPRLLFESPEYRTFYGDYIDLVTRPLLD